MTAALDVLRRAQTGTLRDTPIFAPSVYLEAHNALAALSNRLSERAERAPAVLASAGAA